MDPHAGKVARIIGFSIVLLGGGVLLDLDARALGAITTTAGAAVFALGLIRGWRTVRLNTPPEEIR